MTTPPDELFHYTSPQGLLGILDGGTVWASMVHYMNDGEELVYALDVASELLREELEHEDPQLCREVTEEFLDRIRTFAVFVFSLSAEGDLLSQWRAYSPPEGGFAVGFTTTALAEIGKSHGFQLLQCEYDPSAQRDLLRPIIKEVVASAQTLAPRPMIFKDIPELAERLLIAAASIKHPSFAEEREWRLASASNSWEAVHYRPGPGMLIPYYEVPLSRGESGPVARVMVGPQRHPKLATRAIHNLTVARLKWPLRVESTATPFRQF